MPKKPGQREGYVTVRLKKDVHAKLLEIGWKDETFSDIIARLIEAAEKK
jgi:predicted CopG family antitoxin